LVLATAAAMASVLGCVATPPRSVGAESPLGDDDDCAFPGLDELATSPCGRTPSSTLTPSEDEAASSLEAAEVDDVGGEVSSMPSAVTGSSLEAAEVDDVGGEVLSMPSAVSMASAAQEAEVTASTAKEPRSPRVAEQQRGELIDDGRREALLPTATDGGRAGSAEEPQAAVQHAAEVVRLRDAAAAARRIFSEELSELRAENERLRAAQVAAEREVARLRRRADADRCEIEELRAQVDAGLRAASGKADSPHSGAWERPRSRAQAAAGCGKARAPPGGGGEDLAEASLAKRLAALELMALRSAASGEERARLRRRLQLKWHPDKNAHNAEFATRVLQEMQRQPEWR